MVEPCMTIAIRITLNGKGSEVSITLPEGLEAEATKAFNEFYEQVVADSKDSGLDVSIKEINE